MPASESTLLPAFRVSLGSSASVLSWPPQSPSPEILLGFHPKSLSLDIEGPYLAHQVSPSSLDIHPVTSFPVPKSPPSYLKHHNPFEATDNSWHSQHHSVTSHARFLFLKSQGFLFVCFRTGYEKMVVMSLFPCIRLKKIKLN